LPFSATERVALARAGVRLPDGSDLVAWHREDFLGVVAAARQRLVLVLHEREGGRHLLQSLIEARLPGAADVAIEAPLLDGQPRLPALDFDVRELAVRPLPQRRNHWQLPAVVSIGQRDVESYSSLDKLFYHPHIWVLDYVARLRPGRAADLPDGPLLYGKLAHSLFERFFGERRDWPSMTPADVERWLAGAMPRTITESGAVLAELGRGVDHQRVIAQLERALPELISQFKAADVVAVACETELAAPLTDDVGLRGTVDLIATRRDGALAVIDVKWGGEDRRARLLATNRHLQLATYAYLVAATGALHWPAQAYFIVANASLLAADRHYFPHATVAARTDGEDVQALWQRALASYRWRRAQLDRGWIDVLAAGTEDGARESAPDDTLGADEEPDRFDPFGPLLGWDVSR
jgi:RecB family exonuclease